MSFVAAKLFWLVAESSNLFLLLLCLAALLLFTRWRRLGRRLAALLAVGGAILAVVPVASWLLLPLEQRFPAPASLPGEVDGIIVLGGGVSTELSQRRGQPIVNEHAERLIAMAGLAGRYPQATMVYAGGSASLLAPDYREADAARAVLEMLGIDSGRVLFERESRNSFENVVNARAMVRPAPGDSWLLVTSAWHMPRAVGIFRKLGWPVLPYPVDYLTDGRIDLVKPFNFNEGLGLLHRGSKEWIGLAAYYWLGYTDSLFPAPNG